jgi:hypothetical protein
MSHPFHVLKLVSYEQQNLYWYTFSLGLERQSAYFTLSKKNIWVTHCTPHESNLLSSPVLCSELLRHVRQNTGYPESSFMVFLSPFIQTLGYCILCNNNKRTLKMNPEVWSYAARYGPPTFRRYISPPTWELKWYVGSTVVKKHLASVLRAEIVCGTQYKFWCRHSIAFVNQCLYLLSVRTQL